MPADHQKDTRLPPADTAQPNQGQEGTGIPPPTFTTPHLTATPEAPSSTERSPPVPTNGAVEYGAVSRVGSIQTEGTIGIAARAGPGAFSPSA